MIKINRCEKPTELSDDEVDKLTNDFKNGSKDDVWRKKYIQKALLSMSDEKCCFCEMKLNEEGKHLNIEHFHPKKIYPDEVIAWENLLPSCNRCNTNKSSHDTMKNPIVNPSLQNPKDYFYIRNYRLYSKNREEPIGKTTIDVLSLNDTNDLVVPRFKICEQLQKTTEDLLIKAKDYFSIAQLYTVQRRNTIVNGTRDILKKAQRCEEYSATISTVLLTDPNFGELKRLLSDNNLWTDEMTELETKANETALFPVEL